MIVRAIIKDTQSNSFNINPSLSSSSLVKKDTINNASSNSNNGKSHDSTITNRNSITEGRSSQVGLDISGSTSPQRRFSNNTSPDSKLNLIDNTTNNPVNNISISGNKIVNMKNSMLRV